jgi:hypothetical protein
MTIFLLAKLSPVCIAENTSDIHFSAEGIDQRHSSIWLAHANYDNNTARLRTLKFNKKIGLLILKKEYK